MKTTPNNIIIDQAAIMGARRTIVRIFRNRFPRYTKFDLYMQMELWADIFLKYHFSKAPQCHDKWMASETFHQWCREQYERRNAELLLQMGYDIHHHGRMNKEEYDHFLQLYISKHQMAIGTIYPPKPVIKLISNQTNYL